MRDIRLVQQGNKSSGCGPACIAMLSGKTYEQAVTIIFGDSRSRDLYTNWSDLRSAMIELDIGYSNRIHRQRSWEGIKTLSIVKCGSMGEKGDDWHWVIYDGTTGLLYDPLKKAPTRPDGKFRAPRSHLPITRLRNVSR